MNNVRDAVAGRSSGSHDRLEVEESDSQVNVDAIERVLSVLIGGILLCGLMQHSWLGIVSAVLGGLLVVRGLSGHCPLYGLMESRNARDSTDEFLTDGDTPPVDEFPRRDFE
jgi:uncharacterized membrane protein